MSRGLGIPPRDAYHSAHKPPAADGQPRMVYEGWDAVGLFARVLDVMDYDPEVVLGSDVGFDRCDVLVADLPWQRGYEVFNQRAGVDDGRDYAGFMRCVSALVEAATVPTWLVTGAHAARFLPDADVQIPMMLNEDRAIAYGYRPGMETAARNGEAREFLRTLAETYDCAGDFCAGYGRTGRIFLRAGKRAVLSDVNPQCIGYIAEHAPDWTAGAR